MPKHRHHPPPFGDATPQASGRPMGSVEHSLPTSEPLVRKCICPGGKVPFYCPAHGRVENSNWPLLSSQQGSHVIKFARSPDDHRADLKR